MSLLAAYLLRDKTNALTNLENRIHMNQFLLSTRELPLEAGLP